MGEFLASRAVRRPAIRLVVRRLLDPEFPTGPGDSGRSFDFGVACLRHDFGYRNAKRFGLWNAGQRRQVDDRLYADMRADCAPRPWTQKPTCLVWARIYYEPSASPVGRDAGSRDGSASGRFRRAMTITDRPNGSGVRRSTARSAAAKRLSTPLRPPS